jgi:hypothetical protein
MVHWCSKRPCPQGLPGGEDRPWTFHRRPAPYYGEVESENRWPRPSRQYAASTQGPRGSEVLSEFRWAPAAACSGWRLQAMPISNGAYYTLRTNPTLYPTADRNDFRPRPTGNAEPRPSLH